jgi:iduronate 2-sulfatase
MKLGRCPWFATLVFIALPTIVAAAPAPRLNVLFIVADDLRCSLGSYGDTQARTPNLDRLAARGVRFDRAYVQYTVCNPSRTSFLTGLRPQQTGIVGNATFFRAKLPEVVTLPQLHRQHGWRAESYGKLYHVGQSLDDLRTAWLDTGKSWDKAEMYQPSPAGQAGVTRNLTGGTLRWCVVGQMEGTDEDQPDGKIARDAIAAMERGGAQPWFIGAGFHRPHDPFLTPKKYWELNPESAFKLWRDPADATPMPRLSLGDGFQEAFAKFTDRERMDFLRSYYAGVSFTDANVGKLMAAMDRLKLWESTVVVFIGDHGYHLGERGWWNKHTLYDRSCRAPLIICAPGVKPGVARGLVEFVDLYPTIADLCGVPAPAGLPGQSLRPLLADPSRPGRDAAFTLVVRGRNVGQSVRTDRWRYIEWNAGADGTELYDHERDAEEMHNVAGEARNAGVVAELKARLKRPDLVFRP